MYNSHIHSFFFIKFILCLGSGTIGNHRSPYHCSGPESPISSPHSHSHSPRSRSPCSARSHSPGSPQSQASEISRQESCHSRQSRLSRVTGKTSRSRSPSPSTPRLASNCVSPPLYPRILPYSGPEPPRPYPDGRYPH